MPMDVSGAEIDALRGRITGGAESVMEAVLLAEERVNYAIESAAYVLPTHFATQTGPEVQGGFNQITEGLSEIKALLIALDEKLESYKGGMR